MLGVVVVIAGGVGWLLAGQALHPLRQITATARRIADRSLHERVALGGPNDDAWAALLQRDTKLVVAGEAGSFTTDTTTGVAPLDFAVSRYFTAIPPDAR